MEKKQVLTRILAMIGAVLMWLPILAPIVFTITALLKDNLFRFDYLMPAELFPAVLVGGGLLLWAALRAGSHRKLIGWGLGIAVGSLVVGQVLAIVTGLASGEIEPTGWPWLLVLASLVLYSLSVVTLGVGSLSLLSHLFKTTQASAKNL